MRVHIKYQDASLDSRRNRVRKNTVVSTWNGNPKCAWETFSPSQSDSIIRDAYSTRCSCGECLLCLVKDRMETDELLGLRP